MTDHVEDHQFYCGECLLPFTCPFLIPIHFQLEHEFRCVCDQIFSDRVGLLTHMENVGCRFPFSIEACKPTVTQLSTTEQKSKLAKARRSFSDGAFDAVAVCVRKTDDGFSCNICEKLSKRRYRLRQHVRQSHGLVVKKVTSWHLKTVVQKFGALVGETMACTLCGKPFLKQYNFYEHACVEHKHEICQIIVDYTKVKEQYTNKKSSLTVLCNRFYVKVKEEEYRCLICRNCSPSLRGITRHLRVHGQKLKERFDKILACSTSGQQKKVYFRSSRDAFYNKLRADNTKLKTECDDDSGLSKNSPTSLRSEVVAKRQEQELEFLRGYIARKEAFYYCQLCPAKSRRKGYLYQHLAIRHDDILGETLSTFKQNEVKIFEHRDSSESVITHVTQYGDTRTLGLGNVVGNVEFHSDVWTSENRYKTIGPVLFSKSCDHKPQESQTASDTSFQRLSVSQGSTNATSAHNSLYDRSPGFIDGKLSAAVVRPCKRRPILHPACSENVLASGEFGDSDGQSDHVVGSRLGLPSRKKSNLLPQSPETDRSNAKIVSEVSRSFCSKTRTYICRICSHKLSSKSGWYKHYKQCRVGVKGIRQKSPIIASKHSASDDPILLSESTPVDSQCKSDPSVILGTSNSKKNRRNIQRTWQCATCQCLFISYSTWQRHCVNCKRKHLAFEKGKKRNCTKAEVEFQRKNCCQKGQKFACRICGLKYARIYDAFYHIRQKHGIVDVAGGKDAAGIKLNSVKSQSAVNGSPEKFKSELRNSDRNKVDLENGIVNSRLKSIFVESALRRCAYVQNQIRKENELFFCKLCDKSFLLKKYASKHINRVHLQLKKAKQPPTTSISPITHSLKNVANTKVNRLKVKVLYKSRKKNFSNGTKAFVKGPKLKPEVGNASFVKSCGLCSKRFLSLHNLTAHIVSEHMTIETSPFPCIMCRRNFEKRQYCVRHFVHRHCLDVKSKRGGKTYRCKICDIYFPNRTFRIQHLSEVHADVCMVCSSCSAVFLTASDLQKHTRAIHSEKASDLSECQGSKDVLENQSSNGD